MKTTVSHFPLSSALCQEQFVGLVSFFLYSVRNLVLPKDAQCRRMKSVYLCHVLIIGLRASQMIMSGGAPVYVVRNWSMSWRHSNHCDHWSRRAMVWCKESAYVCILKYWFGEVCCGLQPLNGAVGYAPSETRCNKRGEGLFPRVRVSVSICYRKG